MNNEIISWWSLFPLAVIHRVPHVLGIVFGGVIVVVIVDIIILVVGDCVQITFRTFTFLPNPFFLAQIHNVGESVPRSFPFALCEQLKVCASGDKEVPIVPS